MRNPLCIHQQTRLHGILLLLPCFVGCLVQISWFIPCSLLSVLVYDLLSLICRTPGYACIPRVQRHLPVSSDAESSGQHDSSLGQERNFMMSDGQNSRSLMQFPQYVFVPVPATGLQMAYGNRNGSEVGISESQVEAQKSFLLQQIEVCFWY